MGFTAFFGIVVVALVVGIGVQFLTRSSFAYEWVVIAFAGAFGGYFASETFVGSAVFAGIKDWGPELDGMFIIPAVIGGVILAIVADLGVRTAPRRVPA